jgi:hypothetical protein
MSTLTGPYAGFAGSPTSRHTTAQMPLGTRAYDASGGEYIYVQAGAVIAVNSAVAFQGSALGYDDVRATAAVSRGVVGVATAAFAAGAFGFVKSRGVVRALVANNTAAQSLLAPSAVAGTLAIAAAADLQGTPIVALVAAADSATAGTMVALL